MKETRPIRLAGLAVLAASALVGCSLTAGNKAGGPGEPVVLRIATVLGEPGSMPQVDFLAEQLGQLSSGNVQIQPVYGIGSDASDAERQVVRGVADGTWDLGVVGTRVFDTFGVRSFQALTAPALIDSYPLERAVVESDIPAQMLRPLDGVGVVGLGVLADGLQKPIAVERPLMSVSDWRGVAFATVRSDEASEAIQDLGARPSTLFGSPLDDALDAGEIQGFAKGLAIYRIRNMWRRAPYITANVNLWPQTLAVIGNPDRLGALTPQQRGWLDRALGEAVTASTGLVDGDQGLVPDLCAAGARLSNATPADLRALRAAFAPVYASIEEDAQTDAFVSGIEELKAQLPPPQPLLIPDGCTGPAPAGTGTGPDGASPSSRPATTGVTPLDGVWEVTYSRDEFIAAHPDPSEVVPENDAGHFYLAFRRGASWESRDRSEAGPPRQPDTTYEIQGDTITFSAPGPSGPETWTYRWSVYRDTLTFEKLGGQAPDCSPSVSQGRCEPTGYVVKPWRRVAG